MSMPAWVCTSVCVPVCLCMYKGISTWWKLEADFQGVLYPPMLVNEVIYRGL